MNTQADLAALAANYHRALPGRIRQYLNNRGITDLLIDYHAIGWNGNRITIPVYNREGEIAFFKLAKDPEDQTGPKMMASPGGYAELYEWGAVLPEPGRIIICEGEFDRIVLEANGFIAVTSTAGSGVFKKEWARAFANIPEVYICYDRDEAGAKGSERVASLIPHARIVELPEEVGDGGDVTDFFVRLGKPAKISISCSMPHFRQHPSPQPSRRNPFRSGSRGFRIRPHRTENGSTGS